MQRALRAVAVLCVAVACIAGSVTMARPATAASLTEVTDFGDNPGDLGMHVYVPDNAQGTPAIVLALHGCGGSGPGFYSGSEFASLADQYGFIVIYPSASKKGSCFDSWSAESHTRGGGSDPVSLMSMITYVEKQYNGDPNRVYVTGSSGGGMETNIMLGNYPDVFKAGAVFMGVPFGCFADESDYIPSPGASNCASGRVSKTPQEWGDLVRNAYQGYSGSRPRVQLWHGEQDDFVYYAELQQEIDQWTDVFGLSQTPTNTDTPQASWNRTQYADSSGTVQVEAYSVAGAGHVLPQSGMAAAAIQFFGLDGSAPGKCEPTFPG
jgi:poly(hydroxyalkanoate) depolymerase family esterase